MEWWWSCYGCSGVLTTEEQRRRCDPRSIGRGWMEVERSMYVLLSPRHGIPARRPGRELLRISLTSVYCRTAGSMRGVTRAEQQPKAPKAPPSNGTHTGPMYIHPLSSKKPSPPSMPSSPTPTGQCAAANADPTLVKQTPNPDANPEVIYLTDLCERGL
jgi:hypothetical protein